MSETVSGLVVVNEQQQQQQPQAVTEMKYKNALKRLACLEKQNAILVDELTKSRQCLMQMKLEREVILDRVADSIAEDDQDFDEDEEDISDISDSETGGRNSKLKRELIDELMDEADSDEAFGRVLSELSGYQPAVTNEPRKKSVSLSIGGNAGASIFSGAVATTIPTAIANSKKRKPPTSGSRFNRLSALTQAMRTGIISDDEGAGAQYGVTGSYVETGDSQNNSTIDHFAGDSEDEDEMSQLKKVRRGSLTGQPQVHTGAINSLLNTPTKEDSVTLKVIPVPYDSEGNPILPLSLNMITVHGLGEVIYDRPAYHNKRYIFPVGYTSSRAYLSVISPEASINYISTILDNGPAPLYQVSPEGHPELAFQSTSTTGAWAAVSKAAAAIRGKDAAPSVSGPDYFGLANPTVSMLIEKLLNADKCDQYAPKKYEVSNLVGGKSAKRIEPAILGHSQSNNTNVDIDNSEKSTTVPTESIADNSNFDIHQSYMELDNDPVAIKGMLKRTILKSRGFSLRTTTLDELLRHPVLDRENADPDTLQDLDAFPVPILPRQVSDSLRREFGYPILTRTEWERAPKTLEEVGGDWWRAARLIHETLAVWRNRPGNPVEPDYSTSTNCQRPSRGIENLQQYSDSALAWVQAECVKMYAELQAGCTKRYESAEYLLPKDAGLTEEQEKMIQPALVAVSKAKELHPAIKKEIIGHICAVITSSTKQ